MKTLANFNYGVHPIKVAYLGVYGEPTGYTAGYAHPPLKSARRSAETFRRAIRLTASELIADPAFRALARKAAEKGRSLTVDLLEWEKKDIVREAVAVVRAEVDAERAESERVAKLAREAAAAKALEEAPVRDAVTEAYRDCGYRTCTQGHVARVVIGAKVGASADTHQGDRYSSRCTFRRTTSSHALHVRPDWLSRVEDVGGARCGDMLVLDAEAVGFLPGDTVAYSLRCVRQAAGTGLAVEPVTATAEGGKWVATAKRVVKSLTEMPAPIMADYLEDRGAATEDVMHLRAECV